MQKVVVGHDRASSRPLGSMTRGCDQDVPGVRIDTDVPRTARQVPGPGQETAVSPVVLAGHGAGPVVHDVPS